MKHAKHTPGPWYAERFTKDCEYPEAVLVSSTESYDPMEVVVFNNGGDYTPERQAADARLIASAPELLEALSLMIDHTQCAGMSLEQIRFVNSVLDRADGGSNE